MDQIDFTSAYVWLVLAVVGCFAPMAAFLHGLFLKKESAWLKWCLIACSVAALGMFVHLVCTLCINVPTGDDFDAFLANYFLRGDSERLQYLTAMHGEHRIVMPKLVSELVFRMCGYVDFRYVMYLGNLGLLAYVGIVWNRYRKISMAVPWGCFICLMMTSIISAENTLWALTSVQSNYVLLFGYLALIGTASESLWRFFLGIFCAAAAMVSNGSGVAIWVFVIAQELKRLFIDHASRAALRLSVLVFVALVALGLYFTNYAPPPAPEWHDSVFHWYTPFRIAAYFFAFTGATAIFTSLSVVLGIAVFVAVVLMTLNLKKLKDVPSYFFLLFLLSCGATAALFRNGLGIDQALSYRYRIVAASILIFTIYLLFDVFPAWRRWRRVVLVLATFVAVSVNVSAYFVCYPIQEGKMRARVKLLRDWDSGLETASDEKTAREHSRFHASYEEAVKKGIVRPYCGILSPKDEKGEIGK